MSHSSSEPQRTPDEPQQGPIEPQAVSMPQPQETKINEEEDTTRTRSFRYRINPTYQQTIELKRQLTAHRHLYNAALEQRNTIRETNRYRSDEFKVKINYFMQAAQKKGLAKDFPEFEGVSSHSLGQTLQKLDKAITAHYKCMADLRKMGMSVERAKLLKMRVVGYPKFKSEHTFRSISWWMQGGGAAIKEGKLEIFGIGGILVNWHRSIPTGATLKQAVVKWLPDDHWEVCIQLEMPAAVVIDRYKEKSAGIDLGIHEIVLHTGEKFNQARPLEKYLKKLAIWQRTMTRRAHHLDKITGRPIPGVRASSGYREAQVMAAKIHAKIARIRSDFQHKRSRELAQRFEFLAIEKLEVAKMIQKPNARDKEKKEASIVFNQDPPPPASNKLRRAVADSAFGNFRQLLAYKVPEEGGQLVEIDPNPMTRECNSCGTVHPFAVWRKNHRCINCGKVEYRKINAAKNVLARAVEMEMDKLVLV